MATEHSSRAGARPERRAFAPGNALDVRTAASSSLAGQRVVRAACPHDCPDTCALRVSVRDGRVVRIEGDPDHLQASFPLRCFQRLSLPYIATLRCLWRDNRYTSGTSTPVLSY